LAHSRGLPNSLSRSAKAEEEANTQNVSAFTDHSKSVQEETGLDNHEDVDIEEIQALEN